MNYGLVESAKEWQKRQASPETNTLAPWFYDPVFSRSWYDYLHEVTVGFMMRSVYMVIYSIYLLQIYYPVWVALVETIMVLIAVTSYVKRGM